MPDFTLHRVIDGDTLVIDVQLHDKIWLHDEHLRLKGINCPEMKEAAGLVARDFTAGWISSGAYALVLAPRRDKYGRLLGDLKNANGLLTAALLASGHAVASREAEGEP